MIDPAGIFCDRWRSKSSAINPEAPPPPELVGKTGIEDRLEGSPGSKTLALITPLPVN
jgi:hypothetical protein